MRWCLLDFFLGLLERAWVSWACWALGAQRGAMQRADAQWCALAIA
jgi:hypothetical protein